MPTPKTLTLSLTALATTMVAAVALAGGATASPSLAAAVVAKAPAAPKPHRVSVGSNPYDVAISQQLGKAFVVNDGSVTEVSLLTRRKLDEYSTDGFQGQNAIALMRSNTQGYITNYQKSTVAVFDTETTQVLRQVRVGYRAVDVVKSNTPKGQRAYVALQSPARLVGIQTATGKVVQRITLPQAAQTLTSAPDGKSLWAGSDEDGHVFQVNTTSGKVTRSIDVGPVGPVTSIARAPGGKRLWVAGLGGVGVLDAKTGKTVKFLPILKVFRSGRPNMGALALTGSGRYAYVQDSTFPDNPTTGTIAMVDTRTYRVLHRIPTGIEPIGLAIDTKRDIAYVPNYADDTLTYFRVPQ